MSTALTPGASSQVDPDLNDLILGTAVHLEWPALRPFVESLQRTSFSGEVHFFVAALSPATRTALLSHGITLHDFFYPALRVGTRQITPYTRSFSRIAPIYPRLARELSHVIGDRRSLIRSLYAALSHINVSRFFLYQDFLSRHEGRFARVMISDTRDVFFLQNPFLQLRSGLHCFLEDDTRRLSDCADNAEWITTAFSSEVLAAIGQRPISCAGVTIGATAAMRSYLDLMCEVLMTLPRLVGGMDQGVHNYLLHLGLIPEAVIVPNGAGAVLTLGYAPRVPAMNEPGSEHLPAVLHQYDRHAELTRRLLHSLDE